MNFLSKNISYCITFALSLVITFFFRDDIFMWDNITTASATSSFLYYHGWHIFSMGNFLDCGHPPTMSLYYALCWKILGRHLFVSHFAQMPFLWLLLQQLFFIAEKIFTDAKKYLFLFFSFLLLLADTTFLSQAGQVGFEIPLAAIWLWAVNLLWKRYFDDYSKMNSRYFLFCICLIVMPLLQLRGIPLTISLFVAEVFFQHKMLRWSWKKYFQILLPYLFSAIIFLSWLCLHFAQVGYLFSDPKSSWGPENVGIASWHRVIYNFQIVCLRWTDNGRILLCIALLILAVWYFNKFKKANNFQSFIFCVWIAAVIILSLNFILMTKPICHRYLLPPIILMPFLLVFFISQLNFIKTFFAKSFLIFLFVAMAISGNYFLYYQRYSIGWDSTLAHLPYKNLRQAAVVFANKNNIPSEKCGSRFPITAADSLVYLQQISNAKFQCSVIDESNLENFEYVLYSNVCTSFTDEQKNILQEKYTAIKQWQEGKVVFIFYKKKQRRP